jgi:hypothetical protein
MLPPGVNPNAVKIYHIIYHIIKTAPSTSVHLATRVRRSRVFLSELIFTYFLRGQQHPKCGRAIRLLYPSFFCRFRCSSNATNKSPNEQCCPSSNSSPYFSNHSKLETCPYEVFLLTMADSVTSQNTDRSF